MLSDAKQQGEALSILLLDLDHFKSINDTFGHRAGDDVLIEFTARLRRNMRSGDLLARIGGEEFILVLAGVTPEDVKPLGERLCHSISQTRFSVSGTRQLLSVSMSAGLSGISGAALQKENRSAGSWARLLLEEADQALYVAKSHGRNRLRRFQPAA